jgi:DNA-binding NarL/FixJ family response regulator
MTLQRAKAAEYGDLQMTSRSPSPSPILLASDFPIFRESLKAYFAKSDVEVVACANDGTEVLPLVATFQPRLVLLDLNIAWKGVCDLMDQLHSSSAARTLVMTDGIDNGRVIEALQHGAHGVVPRRTTPEMLLKSVHTVLDGDFWVSRSILTDLIYLFRRISSTPNGRTMLGPIPASSDRPALHASVDADAQAVSSSLTRRERQIIETVVDGQTNRDIAATLGISEYTVKHHLTNIFDKLGVYNRVELVLYAINTGLCHKPAGR